MFIQLLFHRFITRLISQRHWEKNEIKWSFAFFTPFKNRYSFIIWIARAVTAKLSREWDEGEGEVDKRPWCSSLGHSLVVIRTRHTFACIHIQHSAIMARMQHKIPRSMQKLRKKSSAIFIKFYNFVCFVFYGGCHDSCSQFTSWSLFVHFSCSPHTAAEKKHKLNDSTESVSYAIYE